MYPDTSTDPASHDLAAPSAGVPTTVSATATVPEIVEPRSIAWRTSPIDRHGLLVMIMVFVGATGVLTLLGLAIVQWWDGSAAGEADADINRWMEDGRTPRLTTIAEYVSQSSDTITKILLGVALIPVMLWLFRRWHEYAIIVGGLILEVCVFGLSSSLVGRDRPPVEQLDGAPTDSFPSGHIAAATVFYGGIALIIFMRTRRPGPRAAAAVVGIGMPLAIAWARMYLGMHYLTDAIAGMALGVLVLSVMHGVVVRTLPPEESPETHDLVRRGEVAVEPARSAS